MATTSSLDHAKLSILHGQDHLEPTTKFSAVPERQADFPFREQSAIVFTNKA